MKTVNPIVARHGVRPVLVVTAILLLFAAGAAAAEAQKPAAQ